MNVNPGQKDIDFIYASWKHYYECQITCQLKSPRYHTFFHCDTVNHFLKLKMQYFTTTERLFQIRRIKDNVEYYIESSQEPDFEDNEFIYDDIIGLDEVELSGVGLPSSATTDSNDTGGTPTSIISGSSPIASPPLSAPPYNHSSDSSNECAEKKTTFKDAPKVCNNNDLFYQTYDYNICQNCEDFVMHNSLVDVLSAVHIIMFTYYAAYCFLS